MLGSFGVQELLVIFLILVLLFGATKLPQIGRGIGEGIRNFKSGLKADGGESKQHLEDGESEAKARTS